MKYGVILLERVEKYLAQQPETERGVLLAHIETLAQGSSTSVDTKQLKGRVRELIVGNHRVPYFLRDGVFYFVSGFRKKSTKTPKREIDYAVKIYKLVTAQKIYENK